MIFQKELLKSLEIHSDKIAIENGQNQITYSELLRTANKITSFLLKLKLEPETVIGLKFNDKQSLIYSIIGAMNARCIIVPIDGSLPNNRLQAISEELDLKYLITSKECPTIESHLSIESFLIEDLVDNESDSNSIDIEYPTYDSEDSIYIYFTSGSTGKPKGIIGKNSCLLQFLQWEIDTFKIDVDTKVSQFISPYFDAFLRDVFAPLLAGGTICIPPVDEDFFTLEKIVSWIENSKINLIHCVPSLFRIINSNSLTSEMFLNLKNILLSGEKIIPSELKNWYETFGSRIQLVNLYGTTETTMIRSCYKIQPEDVNLPKMPIGQPIRDTEFLVADKNFKPCNLFVVGDLYIISEYTSKGYLNAPELTKEKFIVVDSESSKPRIAFKTGDKARMMTGGMIDLMGREDRQVKLRGMRIELDEIENVLVQSDCVKNAIVIKHTEGEENNSSDSKAINVKSQGNESLIAFILKSEKVSDDSNLQESVLKHLEINLPSYMIPSNILEVKEFPLLENGKINYKGLLQYLVTDKVVAPKNEIESSLLEIWKEILGDKIISTEDSFHSIGGNSLAIMRLIGKIYKEYNVRFTLSELFNNLTIAKQANHIKKSEKDNVLIIPKLEEKACYNLSSAQERIYYNYELNKESTAFNLPMAWVLQGDINKVKLENALSLLIDRHESLRTAFKFENGKQQQIIKDKIDFKIEEIHSEEDNIDQAISNFIRPFDLSVAPLIRAGLIATGKEEKVFIVDIHHIVCDGMSQNNLFSDLMKLYKGDELEALPLQYKDYADWEYKFKQTNDYISHREFWLKNFEGEIPNLQLPVSNLEVDEMSDKGGSISFKVELDIIRKITDDLKKDDITTFSALYSMFFMYLSQLTGQDDIVIGINTSGRIQEELEDVVGMFTKTLPIRYQLDANLKFRDYVKEIHDLLIQANSAQIYDLSDIVREINNNRSTSIKQLFDVMLVFQNFVEKKVQLDEVKLASYEFENKTYKYPITLFASEGDDAMYFRLEYSLLHFAPSDIEEIIKQFKSLIIRVSENLGAKVIQHFDDDLSKSLIIEDEITFNF